MNQDEWNAAYYEARAKRAQKAAEAAARIAPSCPPSPGLDRDQLQHWAHETYLDLDAGGQLDDLKAECAKVSNLLATVAAAIDIEALQEAFEQVYFHIDWLVYRHGGSEDLETLLAELAPFGWALNLAKALMAPHDLAWAEVIL